MGLKTRAFSMVEVMVAIVVFALAILPLVWLSSKQTKEAFHVGKHMMAGQLAATFMDNILHRDYDDVSNIAKKSPYEGDVLENSSNSKIKDFFNLSEMVEGLENEKANENIKISFRNFRYKITLKENLKDSYNSDTKEYGKAISITVEVSYLVSDNKNDRDRTRQYLRINAIKYGEMHK
ncbi:MAG: prepilin-type N-terminal cleavage/methylation domain-containing protein [Candidatus Riflebacteria bacterium]|nr:prepilin-type N-terminal cleavage/methylation domain-containing protein [Candidatus Riflebacteria bacterium]